MERKVKDLKQGPTLLVVADLNGKVVQQLELSGESGTIDWQTGHLPRGIYVCKTFHAGKLSPALKLVLIK